jgi:hypothetical protein
LEGELSYEYTTLAVNLLKWIKTKLDFLHREVQFQTMEEIQTFENILHIIKNDELGKYNQLLQRLRSIDAKFEVKKIFSLPRFLFFLIFRL